MESPITEVPLQAKSSLLKTDSIDVVDCEFSSLFSYLNKKKIETFF